MTLFSWLKGSRKAEEQKPAAAASVFIDPVKMNITNRIAAGSETSGHLKFSGGLLLQGSHEGDLDIAGGPLVLEGGRFVGRVTVHGDAYVFGRVGGPDEAGGETVLTVHGVLHLTGRAETYGLLRCAKLASYNGAKIKGRIETIIEAEPA